MSLQSLQDLYVNELKDLYSAEKQILQALPRMAKAASHNGVRDAFQRHIDQTQEQVKRLETIFDDLQRSPGGHRCRGMAGIMEEGREFLEQDVSPGVRDAALISSAQRVEHYEIAGYGTVRTFAKELGFDEHVRLLQQTLDEEGETNRLLARLAERSVIDSAG